MKKTKGKIEKLLIEIALKIAKQGKGCLFVIASNPVKYKLLFGKDIKPFNIFDNRRRLEILAFVDGAVIIDKDGNMVDYGAEIKITKIFKGFGTRHSAALSASLNNNTSILASEEDKKVRVFKNGKVLLQIDALERNIEKKVPEAVSLLESIGAGTVGTIMASVAGIAGISLIPGIIIFGVPYYVLKRLLQEAKKK